MQIWFGGANVKRRRRLRQSAQAAQNRVCTPSTAFTRQARGETLLPRSVARSEAGERTRQCTQYRYKQQRDEEDGSSRNDG